MEVVIRTDSSSVIGSGHLMRCLTLADRLHGGGASISFICREMPGHLGELVIAAGYTCRFLPMADKAAEAALSWEDDAAQTSALMRAQNDADWLIVDHYGLDFRWEKTMYAYARFILALDDMADRRHECDLLLDQNLVRQFQTRYDTLVPSYCRKLLGPEYALLRPEFSRTRKHLRSRDGRIRRILISPGGADPHDITTQAVEAMRTLDRPDIAVDVVIGAANPQADDIKDRAGGLHNCRVHHPADDMAALMAAADLAVGAGGSTTWERCCLGLPTLCIASTEREIEIARSVDYFGIGKNLGLYSEVSADTIARAIQELSLAPSLMDMWSKTALGLVDGQGADRVCRDMNEYHQSGVVS